MINISPINLPVLILAGGLGTRLQPVVSNVPKPLAEVAGRPFISRLITQASEAGASEVILCVGYKSPQVAQYVSTGAFDIAVNLSVEEAPMGTAGAANLALNRIDDETFIVMNGDSFADVDFGAMLQAHRLHEASVTIAVSEVEEASRYGTVTLADDFQITAFREKAASTGRSFINSGVYVVERSVFDIVPKDEPHSLEQEVFPLLVGRGLYAFPHQGPFIDIGTPDDFARAQSFFPTSP